MMDPFTFAIVKHHGQLRRSSELPYIVHPLEVHNILKDCGYSKSICIAGLFHDVLEDTKTEPEEIEKEFGKDILEIVKLVSENYAGKFDFKKESDKNRYYDACAYIVKCADTLSNMNDWIRGHHGVSKKKVAEYADNLKYALTRNELNSALKQKIDFSLKALVV